MTKLALALALFLGIAGACSAAKVPEIFTNPADHMQARVTTVTLGQGNQFLAPKRGDVCLAAYVVVRNLGKRVNTGGSGTFEIATQKGNTYWQSGSCPVRIPYLPTRSIVPHSRLAGWITIELPKALRGAYLGWTDGGRLTPPGKLTQLALPVT